MLFLISRSRSAVVAFARFTPLNSATRLRVSPSLHTSRNLASEATLSLLGAAVGREATYYESLEDSSGFFVFSRPRLRVSPSLHTSRNLAFEATLSLLGAAVGREVALVTKALRTVLAFLFFHAHDFVFRLRFTRVVTSHPKRHCRFSVLRLVVRLPYYESLEDSWGPC